LKRPSNSYSEDLKVSVYIHIFSPDCEVTFTKRDDTSSTGGQGQSGTFNDAEDCMDACREDSDCLGFDWTLDEDADTRCWLHFDQDAIDDADIGDTDGVDQYVKEECGGKIYAWLSINT
jgi:hypothetical protein